MWGLPLSRLEKVIVCMLIPVVLMCFLIKTAWNWFFKR